MTGGGLLGRIVGTVEAIVRFLHTIGRTGILLLVSVVGLLWAGAESLMSNRPAAVVALGFSVSLWFVTAMPRRSALGVIGYGMATVLLVAGLIYSSSSGA
jgi:hypothetical protein